MADVKWIKITTAIVDDEKIAMIESLHEGDSIIVIWFKLLCLAGKTNNNGVFVINDKLAYTDEMLAIIFRRKVATVRLALKVFQEYGMVDIVEGVITIPKWGKHQNLDSIEKKKEYQRSYMQNYREKQRQIACKTNCNTNSKSNCNTNVSRTDIDKDIEEEIDKEKENKEKVSCQLIADLYNDTCVSLPKCTRLSDSRIKALKARLRKYTVDDFKLLFEKAEASDFLKGANGRNWSANFDWLIKDANMAKVLDGNYDNTGSARGTSNANDYWAEFDRIRSEDND